MKLLNAPLNTQVKLFSTEDVPSLMTKLNQYGLYQGDSLRVVRVAPLGGPLLVQVNGREIALGREIADKIVVEIE
jgi:ferrous iron transport protein A